MKRISLSLPFLAATLLVGLSAKPALAQHFDTANADSAQRESDMLIHQDIAAGRIAARDGIDGMPVRASIEKAAHQGRQLRNNLGAMPTEASSEELARQSRLLCEQQHGIPAAQWRCRSHAQQR
jgi:hypothetical protein